MKRAIILFLAFLMGCGGGPSDPLLTATRLELSKRRTDGAYQKLSSGLYSPDGKNVSLKKIPEAWYTMGELHASKEEFKKMLAAFDKVRALESGAAQTYSTKADAYIKNWAGLLYNRAIKKYNGLASETDESKKMASIDKAIEELTQSIFLEEGADAYGLRAQFKSLKKEDAEPDYRKSLELDPKNTMNRQQLGYYFFNNGKYKEAAVELEKVLTEKQGDPNVTKYLAYAYQNSGNYGKAIEIYNNVLKNDPRNMDALDNLTPLYYNQKMYDKAIENANKAIFNTAECKAEHYIYLTSSYFSVINKLNEDGKKAEAKAKTNECLKTLENGLSTDKHKENGDLWKYASILYARSGQTKKAKDAEANSKKFGTSN